MSVAFHLLEQVKILLIEDNEGDVVLIKEALNEGRINNDLSVLRDGAEAIKFFTEMLEQQRTDFPDLILLDINLPKVDGKAVLEFIKTNDVLKKIPVIMLTSSSSVDDIVDSYNLHANCFITKPVQYAKFMEVVQKIENFWISIVKLPTQQAV